MAGSFDDAASRCFSNFFSQKLPCAQKVSRRFCGNLGNYGNRGIFSVRLSDKMGEKFWKRQRIEGILNFEYPTNRPWKRWKPERVPIE